MAENTKIEWTDATWNPITGCSVHRERLLNATPATDDETWQLAHDLIARFLTCDSIERLTLVFSRNSFAIRAMPQGAFAGVVVEYLRHRARLEAA